MAQPDRTERLVANPRYRWVVLAAGTAAQASFSAVLIGLPVLAPALRERYDLSLSGVGVALSAFWIGPILTLLPWGLLADRVGERIVLATGLSLCGLLVAVAGSTHSFVAFVALMTIAGGMGASVNAASGRAVMQWFPLQERGFALGVRQTAIPVGGAIAAVLLPVFNDLGGFEAAFLFLAGLCVAAAAGAFAAVREAQPTTKELGTQEVEWTLADSRLWILCTGSGLYLFVQIALTSFLVLFLHDEHGLSDGAAAAALAVLQVCAIVTRISAGRLSDSMRERIRPLRWIGLGSTAGVLITAVLVDAPVALVVPVMIVAGAISMAWNGLSVTAAAELAGPAKSGAAIGFQQTTLAVIGVIVPVAFASLVESTSWQAGFALVAAGPLVGWYLLGRLPDS